MTDTRKALEYEIYNNNRNREKWNLSARRVGALRSKGRIPDVQKAGNTWLIPENAEKPADARIKNGKYI